MTFVTPGLGAGAVSTLAWLVEGCCCCGHGVSHLGTAPARRVQRGSAGAVRFGWLGAMGGWRLLHAWALPRPCRPTAPGKHQLSVREGGAATLGADNRPPGGVQAAFLYGHLPSYTLIHLPTHSPAFPYIPIYAFPCSGLPISSPAFLYTLLHFYMLIHLPTSSSAFPHTPLPPVPHPPSYMPIHSPIGSPAQLPFYMLLCLPRHSPDLYTFTHLPVHSLTLLYSHPPSYTLSHLPTHSPALQSTGAASSTS